jgi:hypothetical protein
MPLTGEQIRLRGLEALRRELGRAGLARFLQHFEPGAGNYTRERSKHLAGLRLGDLRERVEQRTKKTTRRSA